MSEKVDSPRGTALSLYNRFAELMLVVGLDENTGLVPLKKDGSSGDSDDLSNLFYEEYEAQVLVAISSSKALVFQPYLLEDPTYPPSPESTMATNSFQTLRQREISKKIAQRTVSVNSSVIKQHLVSNDNSNSASQVLVDLPLSKDAIDTITTFCFPDNAHVFQDKPDNNIHFLVLTDVSGLKTYACCLTFYKPYQLTKEPNGKMSYELRELKDKSNNSDKSSNSIKSVHCYIPQCCVLVSKYPYFYAMKECMSCMISHVERDLEEMFQFLKDFTYTMTMSPVPPAGNVIVEICIYNLFISLFPPDSPDKPVLDIPLHLTFLCFPIEELLKIFTAILCEEKLVFISFNYALLTTVMQSFLYYILPFTWRFTYVPILSASSLELLEAPGTFMMGCHPKHLHVVQQVEGLVVVNIDEGTITVNKPSEITSPYIFSNSSYNYDTVTIERNDYIPYLPVGPAGLLKNICKRSKYQMELSDVQRPFYFDIEEERAFRMKKCMQFNTEISFAFLEMMVNLFRGCLLYLRIEHRSFNKKVFLESVPECDKPFYERVLNTDMFKQFLEDRLNEKMDYWYEYELKTRPYNKPIPGTLYYRPNARPATKQTSITTFSSLAPRTFEIFRLPALNDSLSYARNMMNMLNETIETCQNMFTKSSYLYLRGMFHAAQGNITDALDDLLSLHSINTRLLPIQFVRKLLQITPETERDKLLRKKGVQHLIVLLHEPETEKPRRPIVDKVSIPDADLNLEEFVEAVSLLEMATDYDLIQRLFLALVLPNRMTHVDKYTFNVLKLSYDENQSQCESLQLAEDCLQANEIVLRVSNLIKTDFGMGRIVLTDKRLFFIKDVSNRYKEIVKLRNITKLEKVQNHSFLIAADVLVITDTETKVKFTAWLKEERNCWATIIEEMRAGRIVAEASKDYTAINQAIQNVLLADAVIRSGQDERVAHHGLVARAADSLCYFTAYMAEGRHNLPSDTIATLQHRVDPNTGQRERKTVEVLLYTPGCQSSGMQNNIPPRLWCGMGDGKIRVFDATNWMLEHNFIQTKITVSALVAVGEATIWAGSYGIYIIETETLSCNKTLTDHPDLVADIVLTPDGRHAYSASVDGTVIKWEVQTLRRVRRFRLSDAKSLRFIKLYDNKLWCGTWHSIFALDDNGVQLQTFTYSEPDTGKPVEINCFEIFHDEIWAGCRRGGEVVIWDEKSTNLKQVLQLDCRGVCFILLFNDKVWVATKEGTIHIYYLATKQQWKTIKAHDDAIRSLCAAESRYIMSGAGSKDGKVAIWSPNTEISEHENGE
ncbi:DENN domain-containing protein 3, partial [Biomphalaria glabrata]